MSEVPLDPRTVAEARRIMASHARSFDRAAGLLPRRVRDRAAVVYAFCRRIDDAVDEAADEAQARRRLAALSEALRRACHRGPRRGADVVGGYVTIAHTRPAPMVMLDAARTLIAGAASDLGPVGVADDGALIRYCYQVAGVVGLMMCGVLEVDDPRAMPFAVDLGIAMQLTNICRDVAEDAEMGRVYLPATRLARQGIDADRFCRRPSDSPGLRRVVGDLLRLADDYYASADQGMRFIPGSARTAIVVASRLYRGIGLRLRARGCDVMAGRTVVPRPHKALLIGRGLIEALSPTVVGLTKTTPHHHGLHRHLGGLSGTTHA